MTNLMTTRRRVATGAAAAVAAALTTFSPAATAAPPDRYGPFPVDDALLADVTTAVESRCGVQVVGATGSGEVWFAHFSTAPDAGVVRGTGWYHVSVTITLADGRTGTYRDASTDHFDVVDGEFVLTATSGLAGTALFVVGHVHADGGVSGRELDPCSALQ